MNPIQSHTRHRHVHRTLRKQFEKNERDNSIIKMGIIIINNDNSDNDDSSDDKKKG